MTKDGRRRLDEIEATMREMGVPDVDGWRRRADAMQDEYERQPVYRRVWWWLVGRVDGIHTRAFTTRQTRELEVKAQAEFLTQHPDYAEALRRGDEAQARSLLAEIVASGRLDMWRSESFARFLAAGLRERGFTEDEIAGVCAMLANLRLGLRDS